MGIYASIYDPAHGRDSLSVWPAEVSEVLVVNAEGPFERNRGEPAVEIVMREFPWGRVLHAAPLDDDGNRMDGPAILMKGYSYIASSDDRFSALCGKLLGHRFYGAVALHDRKEG